MKGIVLKDIKVLEVADLEKVERKEGDATVKILNIGICGSDVTAFLGNNPTVTYPRVLGHEAIGEIVDLDEDEKEFIIGDRVVIRPFINCGSCEPCRKGKGNNCESLKVIGVREDGGMVDEINHPVNHLFKIPDQLPNHVATMTEPLSISLHSVRQGNIKGGDNVVIFGAGTIGLLAALVCKAYGANPILIDINEERLEVARKKGIRHTINSGDLNNILKVVRDMLNDKLPDVVIECSGAEGPMQSTIEVVKHGGLIVFVGWAKGNIAINQPRILQKELTIKGSRNSFNEFPECLRLLSEKLVDVEDLIDLREGYEALIEGINDLIEKPGQYTKIISKIN